jgi:hypothetical protein
MSNKKNSYNYALGSTIITTNIYNYGPTANDTGYLPLPAIIVDVQIIIVERPITTVQNIAITTPLSTIMTKQTTVMLPYCILAISHQMGS